MVELKEKPKGIERAKALVIFLDYEDAVQYVICMRNGCDALITRNKADYGNKVNVLDPA